MIRTIGLAAAILGGLVSGAAAQNALSFWDGRAVINTVNAACRQAGSAAGNVGVGKVYASSYRARLDEQNEPNTGITFVDARSMLTYFNHASTGDTADDQMHGRGTYALKALKGNATSIPRPSDPPVITGTYVFRIKPAVIDASTDVVTIDGTIFDWRGVTDCRVSFSAAYRANPDNVVP